MSTHITEYTTYSGIRAALGVSSDDLEDDVLALDLYADALEVEFDDVSVNFDALWQAARSATAPTTVQSKFLTAVRLFASYAVAKQATVSLPIFAAKQVSDSKTTLQRFDNPYKDTIKGVNDQYGKMRNRLLATVAALNASTTTTVAKTYFAVVSPSVDPITGS